MKINSKQVCIVVVLLLVVGGIMYYNMFYTPTVEKIDSLKASNKTLSTKLESLKEYYDHEEEYKTDIASMKNLISTIANKYPSQYLEEDYLSEALQVEGASVITYTGIDIAKAIILKSVSQDTVQNAAVDGYEEEIDFVLQTVSYNNIIDYPNLKNAIKEIFSSDYQVNLYNMSYSCDEETGFLNGALTLGYYSVSGTGKEYVAPKFTPYEAGVENIFGTFILDEEEAATEGTVAE